MATGRQDQARHTGLEEGHLSGNYLCKDISTKHPDFLLSSADTLHN